MGRGSPFSVGPKSFGNSLRRPSCARFRWRHILRITGQGNCDAFLGELRENPSPDLTVRTHGAGSCTQARLSTIERPIFLGGIGEARVVLAFPVYLQAFRYKTLKRGRIIAPLQAASTLNITEDTKAPCRGWIEETPIGQDLPDQNRTCRVDRSIRIAILLLVCIRCRLFKLD